MGIFDSSIPLLVIGLVIAIGCGSGWGKTGHRALLGGVVAGILIAIAGILLDQFIETDREKLESVIQAVAADVRAGRVEEAVSHISADAGDLRERARGELRNYKVTGITIKRPVLITFEPSQGRPTRASAEFNIVVTGGDAGGLIENQQVPRYLIVRFGRDGERWLADDYEHHEPLYGMRSREN
jgi:hypothetical protein